MDKQVEEMIERRLRAVFSNGMPATALDQGGLQTRGSFLKERPASPFGCVRKRAQRDVEMRVMGDGDVMDGRDEEKGGGGDGDGDGDGDGMRRCGTESSAEVSVSCSDSEESVEEEEGEGEGEGEEDEDGDGEEDGEEDDEEDGGEENVAEERRRLFRRQVEDNRQYRERLLRG